MPKNLNIKSVLIIGAGPIVIGQGCEFDYAGTQACKALREEGCRVILVNSNPATIMTDPEVADATYLEPLTKEALAKIIAYERPDALLPTMGGQTALNCAITLSEAGILTNYGVELIGASLTTIKKAEDRELFKQTMNLVNIKTPQSWFVKDFQEAVNLKALLCFPIIIRTSYTLGGQGGGICKHRDDFLDLIKNALRISPQGVLVEQSLLGWKEYELEVMRDQNGNCIVVCGIENFDPMGIHTGDSITVAPIQTLTDKEYQQMRIDAFKVLEMIEMRSGGCNIQFAVNPETGERIVIEVNPRVSRSSALASKATGFPIAKIAAKLSLGYTLCELQNDITGGAIPASFEPTLDYVVVKIPRFDFERYPQTDTTLGIQMRSIGEVMAIGRNFQEALQKAICSLKTRATGLDEIHLPSENDHLEDFLSRGSSKRLFYLAEAFRQGWELEKIFNFTRIDPWFLEQIRQLVDWEIYVQKHPCTFKDILYLLKQKGFSDQRLAFILKINETEIRSIRRQLQITPVFKCVDSCAGEFPSQTSYFYSTYEEECESLPSSCRKIIIIGSGPNRIGQGIEFDYCCVHAALALREHDIEAIMINSNPETVSTDYDISTRLYFEPLTLEHTLSIINLEKPEGVLLQFGGQTSINLAHALEKEGVPIIGISGKIIDLVEDRLKFAEFLTLNKLVGPFFYSLNSCEEALSKIDEYTYPLILRPSYIIGGSSIKIAFTPDELRSLLEHSMHTHSKIFIEQLLDNAIEVEIDAVSDGQEIFIGGIVQQMDLAGIHSGDSWASMAPYHLTDKLTQELIRQTTIVGKNLEIKGLFNIQFAIHDETIYILEVNPRASRTVPLLSKITGLPLVKIAISCLLGNKLCDVLKSFPKTQNKFWAVKAPVFSHDRFPDVICKLGPEMRSTGEVLGIGLSFEEARWKAEVALNSHENHETKINIYCLQEILSPATM